MPVFENIFEAFDDSAMCPQFDDVAAGTLDCLHLNVYVPTSAISTNQLPVLVWIHTGAFTSGSSGRAVYGPKFLVRHDIILVTFNYRLGPYGFLCLDTPAVPGNQGLKDQQLAFRWIKDNIAAFGGDANRITLFGQSAGSKSIDFHMHLSEEILFNQAILQSGTILTPALIKNPGRDAAFKLAEHLGYVTSDVDDALSFISTVDTNTIIASVNELGLHFEACIEQQFDGVNALVTDHPINLQVPNVRSIPLLVGCTDVEELLTYGNANDDFLRNSDIIGDIIKNSFDFENDTYFDEMKEFVKQFYLGDKDVSTETLPEIMDLASDFRAVSPLQRSIRKYFNNGADRIFYYLFSYDGERNYMKNVLNITFAGAAHIDELGYLFDVAVLQSAVQPDDLVMVDRMTTMWTNFVKYGYVLATSVPFLNYLQQSSLLIFTSGIISILRCCYS